MHSAARSALQPAGQPITVCSAQAHAAVLSEIPGVPAVAAQVLCLSAHDTEIQTMSCTSDAMAETHGGKCVPA